MDTVTHYDLAVIGTGSGNSIVDQRFADWRVAIIEENLFGGTCLNVGCIPTKMFVYPADLARDARHAPALGVDTSYDGARLAGDPRPHLRADRPDRRGRESYREGLPNVDVYTRTPPSSTTTPSGARRQAGEQITADQIVIAAGSRVDVAPIPGLDEVGLPHQRHRDAARLELPRRMTIIGGGYVAAEFAHVFSALGTEVTQVQRGPLLLREQDEDVSAHVHRARRPAVGRAARHHGDRGRARRTAPITVSLSDGTELETDVLLIATGRVAQRRPPRAGEHLDRGRGRPRRASTSTSAPRVDGVWALGDVSNDFAAQARRQPRGPHRAAQPAAPRRPGRQRPPLRAQRGVHLPPDRHGRAHLAGRPGSRGSSTSPSPTTTPTSPTDGPWRAPRESSSSSWSATPTGEQLLGAHIIGPQASLLIQPLIQAMSLGNDRRRDGPRPVLDPPGHGRGRRECIVEIDPTIGCRRVLVP